MSITFRIDRVFSRSPITSRSRSDGGGPARRRPVGRMTLVEIEPLGTLDALHLASMLELLAPFPDQRVLSLDDRILANLEPLGLAEAAQA